MSGKRTAYVLDSGPLSHFARSQWLGVLKAVLRDTQVLIPDVVETELRSGTENIITYGRSSTPIGSR